MIKIITIGDHDLKYDMPLDRLNQFLAKHKIRFAEMVSFLEENMTSHMIELVRMGVRAGDEDRKQIKDEDIYAITGPKMTSLYKLLIPLMEYYGIISEDEEQKLLKLCDKGVGVLTKELRRIYLEKAGQDPND